MEKFLGCPYPIIKHPKGYFRKTSGIDQIKSDLLILLLTNPGERCLSGNTKIPLADGTEIFIADLVGRDPFWVYSFDIERNRIVAGKATAHKTAENAAVCRVTLDNNESVICTGNHLWLLRDGTYARADELAVGQSLMPLYRKHNTSGYERVYQPYLGDYRETHLCFVEGTRLSGEREVVHHKDLNKINNSPDNLQWMTRVDHHDLHKEISNAFCLKMKSDPEFRSAFCEKVSQGLRRYFAENDGNRKGAKLTVLQKAKLSEIKRKFYDSDAGEIAKQKIREAVCQQFATQGNPMQGLNHSEEAKAKMRGPREAMAGDGNPSKRPEVREKLRLAWERRRLKNHKVLQVENLAERMDCFDLYVEQYHNFAVSAGVFVHNCMLPDFGTPLRDLIFDPNDGTVADRAKSMISRSIEAWEPRIAVEDIQVLAEPDEASLNPYDSRTEIGGILMIRITFRDPENITEVFDLKLDVPLDGGSV